MAETHQGEPTLLKRVAALVAAALAIWALAVLIGGQSGVLATLRSQARLEELERRIAEQEAVNERLREEVRQLEEDSGAIEKVAREQLLMARPDEVIILVPDPVDAAPSAPAPRGGP